jgi:hypothetical protein
VRLRLRPILSIRTLKVWQTVASEWRTVLTRAQSESAAGISPHMLDQAVGKWGEDEWLFNGQCGAVQYLPGQVVGM